MRSYDYASTHLELRSGLVAFLGEQGIVDMSEFLLGGVGEMVVVLACYLGVDEGVDMWFDKNSNGSSPRFVLFLLLFFPILIGNYFSLC
jgi:hypothetical protein